MAERTDVLADLDVSFEELDSLAKAFKDDTFKQMFGDYAKEVTDPENRKLYQKEITELEKERGVNCTFINPEPGYVLKTFNGDKKVFINLCTNPIINKPTCERSHDANQSGLRWSIPYSQSPPHTDYDNKKKKCTVYDVVFHPETLDLVMRSSKIRDLVEKIALEAVESNFDVELDKNNVKRPRMSFKGLPHASVIRTKIEGMFEENQEKPFMQMPGLPRSTTSPKPVEKPRKPVQQSPYTIPHYETTYRSNFDMQECRNSQDAKLHATLPDAIILRVDLPCLKSASSLNIDIKEKQFLLQSETPAKYKLEISLTYPVDSTNSTVQFILDNHKLQVVMPVIRPVDTAIQPGDTYRTKEQESRSTKDITAKLNEESLRGDDYDNMSVNDNNIVTSTFTQDSNETDSLSRKAESKGLIANIHKTDEKSPSMSVFNEKSSETTENVNTNADAQTSNSFGNGGAENCNTELQHTVGVMQDDNGNSVANSNDLLPDNTGKKNVSKLLSPKYKYFLPQFSCHVYNMTLCFTLNVRNIDHDSVKQEVYSSNAVQLTFRSLGAGFVPMHYGFCAEVPCGLTILTGEVEVEVWDNNMTVQFQVQGEAHNLDYYVGSTAENLEKHTLPEMPVEMEDNGEETECSDTIGNDPHPTSLEEDDLSSAEFIDCYEMNEKEDDLPHEEECNSVPDSGFTGYISQTDDESAQCSYEPSPTIHGLKSILKGSRSFSESSVDELVGSFDNSPDSVFSDGPDYSKRIKKAVRFNDSIQRMTFRADASILGQRKKNQKKARSKRRARARRASESEHSDADVDHVTGKTSSERSASTSSRYSQREERDTKLQDKHASATGKEEKDTSKDVCMPSTSGRSCADDSEEKSTPDNESDNTQSELGNDLMFALDL